jgi:hypothetical protein
MDKRGCFSVLLMVGTILKIFVPTRGHQPLKDFPKIWENIPRFVSQNLDKY